MARPKTPFDMAVETKKLGKRESTEVKFLKISRVKRGKIKLKIQAKERFQ
jgi:hypothetical protein